MIILGLLVLASAPQPLRVALPDFSAVNVSPESAAFFVDRFANRLRTADVKVTTATEIETVLGLERQKELLGCEENASCTAELASALGVDAIARVRLAHFGARYELTMTLIDAKDATVLATFTGGAADESELLRQLEVAADELRAKLRASKGRPAAGPEVRVTAEPGRPTWLAPALGGAGVLAGVGGSLLLVRSFQEVEQIAVAPDPTAVANAARTDRAAGLVLATVGVAALVASAVLFVGGRGDAPAPAVWVTPDGAYLAVSGTLP